MEILVPWVKSLNDCFVWLNWALPASRFKGRFSDLDKCPLYRRSCQASVLFFGSAVYSRSENDFECAGGLRGNGIAHCPCSRGRKLLALLSQFVNLFSNERAKLAVRFLLGRPMTDAAPGEKVRAITHVKLVGLFPPYEL